MDPHSERAPAYPGSKDYFLVPEALIAGDRRLLGILLRMGEGLPLPKSRKRSSRS